MKYYCLYINHESNFKGWAIALEGEQYDDFYARMYAIHPCCELHFVIGREAD